MTTPIMQFEDVLVERGGKPVIAAPSLCIRRGVVTAIAGDNGSGKTTLVLAAAGLLNLARGRILLNGEVFNGGRAPAPCELRRKTALVLQEPFMFGGSVLRNVEAGFRYRNIEKEKAAKEGMATLESLGIAGIGKRKAKELSGGQKKLVAIAQALAIRPEILFFDEPTANLDENFRERVEAAIKSFAESGGTVVAVLHDPAQICRLGDEIVRVRGGLAEKQEGGSDAFDDD